MVVIDDFRKQILYQKLNLGYDCTFCKKKFYSKREQLQHLNESHLNPSKKEQFECPKCGKIFGHSHIYQLHLQIHALSEPQQIKSTNNDAIKKNASCVSKSKKTSPLQSTKTSNNKERPWKTSSSTSTTKKAVGLTKVKMEDCMRCDACSCIYIDRNDYYKHMRNFHKVNSLPDIQITTSSLEKLVPSPKTVASLSTSVVERSSTSNTTSPNKHVNSPKKCKSCCKYCRGNHIASESHMPHRATRILQTTSSNELFKFNMRDNIKDRWSKMVSQRLLETNDLHEQIKIKPDPDAMELDSPIHNHIDSDEMSHLLSQVEVKIKTEPPDER